MKKTKFRSWDSKLLKFNYFNLFNVIGSVSDEVKLTIQQYTGLKDKNGKEIYEGDLYKTIYLNPVYQIFFYNGAVCGGKALNNCSPINWTVDEDDLEIIQDNFTSCIEVIGNIYETPSTS